MLLTFPQVDHPWAEGRSSTECRLSRHCGGVARVADRPVERRGRARAAPCAQRGRATPLLAIAWPCEILAPITRQFARHGFDPFLRSCGLHIVSSTRKLLWSSDILASLPSSCTGSEGESF
eukprot:6177123-Pleurochrysis_carterae.AAC.2